MKFLLTIWVVVMLSLGCEKTVKLEACEQLCKQKGADRGFLGEGPVCCCVFPVPAGRVVLVDGGTK